MDLAALILILVFGAFANAAGMVGPVVEWEERARSWLGFQSTLPVVTAFYVVMLVVAPLLLVSGAAALGRRLGKLKTNWLETATRYSYALVPLGFGLWLSHYCFHLLTSYDTVIPTSQRFAADLGLANLGKPLWSYSCCRSVADWLPRLEILFLDFGLLLSLYVGYRIARAQTVGMRQAGRAFVPWMLLIGLLFAAAVWIVLQPMQMRGTLPMTG